MNQQGCKKDLAASTDNGNEHKIDNSRRISSRSLEERKKQIKKAFRPSYLHINDNGGESSNSKKNKSKRKSI